jgi:hypothetical protein
MSRIQIPWLLPALATLLLCAVAPAHAGGKADPRLDGDWQLDSSSSDDFDARLKRMADEMRARRRNQRGPMGGGSAGGPGGYGATDEYGQVPGLVQELPPETHDELRERFDETYRPPSHLHIRSREGEVDLLGDTRPERRFSLSETVTRMDVSGTSTLSTNWSSNALVVLARYTNRLRSEQRYSVDKSGGALNVTLQLVDPIAGKLQLHSTYRRVVLPAAKP